MKIYFIRHTTPNIEPGICYGQADIDVTSSFTHESEKILSTLQQGENTDNYEYIFTSPAKRCYKLARKIQQQHKNSTQLFTRQELLEVNFGDWELRAWNDIPRTESQTWMGDFINQRPPNGESLLELQDRVQHFLTELIAMNFDNAIVCTHAGVMRLIAAQYLNIPLSEIFTIKLDYGQIMLLEKHLNSLNLQLSV